MRFELNKGFWSKNLSDDERQLCAVLFDRISGELMITTVSERLVLERALEKYVRAKRVHDDRSENAVKLSNSCDGMFLKMIDSLIRRRVGVASPKDESLDLTKVREYLNVEKKRKKLVKVVK